MCRESRGAPSAPGLFSGLGFRSPNRPDRGRDPPYRAVYTVRFKAAVYVLHAFRKKAKRGLATPKREIELIKRRLRVAEQHYEANYGKG